MKKGGVRIQINKIPANPMPMLMPKSNPTFSIFHPFMGALPLKHNIACTLKSHWSSCRGPLEQFPSSHFSFPYLTAMCPTEIGQ